MTEDEAKTKRCHQTLYGAQSIEDGSEGTAGTNCIGSACMAWRWTKGYRTYLDMQNGDVSQSLTDGGCGLAGAPQ